MGKRPLAAKMNDTDKVYAAYRSVPDYSAPSPSLHSLHRTLEGAEQALYPGEIGQFTPSHFIPNSWNGPDGFGMIRLMEIHE